MSDIDDIIDSIQKMLQRDGLSAALSEMEYVAKELPDLHKMVNNLEASGEFDGLMTLRGSLRAAQAELSNAKRTIGQPEAVLNDAILRIRDA